MQIVLSNKAAKLMKLCDAEGFRSVDDLLQASASNCLCPAICMTEGCDHTAKKASNQEHGFCLACGGNTMASALVLAGRK
ncbi:MAG: hypothetical protein QOF19_3385 [Alphaproteobacteria bacterium]|jgi:hypothetical protein|nr:hypothetical protein [Alphaproteobacteria bacterium]